MSRMSIVDAIEELNALPVQDRQGAIFSVTLKNGHTLRIPISDQEIDILRIAKRVFYSKQKSAHRKGRLEGSQKILWKGILINFIPNQYTQDYQEIWRIESILSSDFVRKALRKHPVLDANFVEELFRQSPYFFYINEPETYLFSDYGDLDESEGRPLKQLTALDALQRYGLKLLEESKEKQYVRL